MRDTRLHDLKDELILEAKEEADREAYRDPDPHDEYDRVPDWPEAFRHALQSRGLGVSESIEGPVGPTGAMGPMPSGFTPIG